VLWRASSVHHLTRERVAHLVKVEFGGFAAYHQSVMQRMRVDVDARSVADSRMNFLTNPRRASRKSFKPSSSGGSSGGLFKKMMLMMMMMMMVAVVVVVGWFRRRKDGERENFPFLSRGESKGGIEVHQMSDKMHGFDRRKIV